ncbi:MAG TPA: DUF6491 family protein [Phenylobacterium sp.]
MKTTAVLGCTAALLGACASPQPHHAAYAERVGSDAVDTTRTASGCFRMNDIRAHRIADPQTLYIEVAGRDTYRVDMSGACLAGASRQETLVTESASGSGLVCKPIDLNLKVSMSGGILSPCIVRAITPLSPAEVAELPDDLRP